MVLTGHFHLFWVTAQNEEKYNATHFVMAGHISFNYFNLVFVAFLPVSVWQMHLQNLLNKPHNTYFLGIANLYYFFSLFQ